MRTLLLLTLGGIELAFGCGCETTCEQLCGQTEALCEGAVSKGITLTFDEDGCLAQCEDAYAATSPEVRESFDDLIGRCSAESECVEYYVCVQGG